MSTNVLAVLIVGPMAAVVLALFFVVWRERESLREAAVAVVAGTLVYGWRWVTRDA